MGTSMGSIGGMFSTQLSAADQAMHDAQDRVTNKGDSATTADMLNMQMAINKEATASGMATQTIAALAQMEKGIYEKWNA